METSLVLLLGVFIAYAVLLYYVFIVRRASDPGGAGKSGLLVMVFVLAPVIVFALWNQSQSEDRLEDMGIRSHPAFESSVGIATGIGENGAWVFSTSAAPASIIDFYRQSENRSGWSILADSDSSLVLGRAQERIAIHVGDDTVIFTRLTGM